MTLWILVITLVMAVGSAVFWIMEFNEGFTVLRSIKQPESSKNPFKDISRKIEYLSLMIKALLSFWKLAIDITATVWLAGAFSLGGMTGAAAGLAISNVISIYLLTRE